MPALPILLSAVSRFFGMVFTFGSMLRMFKMNQNAPAVVSTVNTAVSMILSPAMSPKVMNT